MFSSQHKASLFVLANDLFIKAIEPSVTSQLNGKGTHELCIDGLVATSSGQITNVRFNKLLATLVSFSGNKGFSNP